MMKMKNTRTKWTSGFLAFIMLFTLFSPGLSIKVQAVDSGTNSSYYVSPDGNDSNPGTLEEPWKTVEKAREEVRSQNDNMTEDIVVYLREGTYYLDQTIEFNEEDSGTNGHFIKYAAYPGEKPVLSGGKAVTGWERDEDNPNLYKTSLDRDEKLRALYVNGERAYMTSKTLNSPGSYGTYTIEKGQADWAWQSGTTAAGTKFNATDLPASTRNQSDIELETTMTWNKVFVSVDNIEDLGNGEVAAILQQPYGALAQRINWSPYRPNGQQVVYNVFEWLDKPGQFYFDRENQTLFYYPRDGENMDSADVVVPTLETLVNMEGNPSTDQVRNIEFNGITFAHTDFNLYELEGSSGLATVQAATIVTAFADPNWHNDLYRNYDLFPAAIRIDSARDIKVKDGAINLTGAVGISVENDVEDIEISGNVSYETGGAGIVVGHPQHVYENDWNNPEYQLNGKASSSLEKYKNGTESVPKDIKIQNNFMYNNGSLFAGHAPITSFYTQRMFVENNFIYGAAYSGMSIGWGWWNFDGSAGSILPGKPTQTSKENFINYNRVEEIGRILHDCGAIYTLGQQGNDDWTQSSEISYNYLNVSRNENVADGSRWVNGIHPDEGSAYIEMEQNVITNAIRSVYEIQEFGRKHDLKVRDGFSNTSRMLCCAPNTTVENQFVDENYVWPVMGYEVVMNAGLENEYMHLVSQDLINNTERVFPSNVRVSSSGVIPINGVLNSGDEIWFAPAGTEEFAESDTMTRANGDSMTMMTPEELGEYKLYIKYENGTVSEPSEFTLYIGDQVANVQEGETYWVSQKTPLRLQLNDNYTYTLNDVEIEDDHQITQAGSYTLVATSSFGMEPVTINFEADVTEANRLLLTDKYVLPGAEVELAENLNDPSKSIWILPQVTTVIEEGPQMIRIDGDQQTITAPLVPDIYSIAVLDENKNVLSRSDTTLYVSAGTLPPSDGKVLWFDANKGITTDDQGRVSEWNDQSESGLIAKQETTENKPLLIEDTINGNNALQFNGTESYLEFSPLDLNGLEGASIFIVSKSNTTNDGKSENGDSHSPIYFHEAGSWGKIYFTPFQDRVLGRFGTGQSWNSVTYERPEPELGFSVSGFVKDGEEEHIYVDGELVQTQDGKQVPLANNSTTGWIGMAQAGDNFSFYEGEIAEILIFDKPLEESELADLNNYFEEKYFSYNVSFETKGGSDVTSQKVRQNETVTEPETPTKEGYEFDGWYSDSELTTAFDFSSPITEKTTLYAKWNPLQYTVAFNENGGTEVESQTVAYKELVTEPAAPTKDGYEFDGWYSDSELSTAFDLTQAITADTTLYAKWNAVQYNVLFNTNGGNSLDGQTVTHGASAVEPNAPVKEGYEFDGWYSDNELSTAFDFTQAITEDTTLYAKWNALSYNVLFNTNGGNSLDGQTVTHGASAVEPNAPVKEGHEFDGWYSDSELTNSFDFTTPITEDTTLYAKWINDDETNPADPDPSDGSDNSIADITLKNLSNYYNSESKELTIDNVSEVTIAKDVWSSLDADAVLSLNRDGINIKIPISNFGNDRELTFSIEDVSADYSSAVSKVFDITIKDEDEDGNVISQFTNPVTLAFTVDFSTVSDVANLKLGYIDENGEIQYFDIISYDEVNGKVYAEVNHFSKYGIFEQSDDTDAGNDSEDNEELPDTASNVFNLLAIGMLVTLAGGLLLVFRRKLMNKSIS